MIRGTTPTFTLTINDTVDLTEAANVYVTFHSRQGDLTKTGDDLEISANVVNVYLTQEETLSFVVGRCELQINWTYNDGSRACTNIVTVDVGANLINEVLE